MDIQVIDSYSGHEGSIRFIQQLRLYHFNRPNIRRWRATRHGRPYLLDSTDRLIIQINPQELTAVDCAGWYFRNFGINTVCIESHDLARVYDPTCHVEHDMLTHRPTYVSDQSVVLFKQPWFLRYATVDQLLGFLNTWAQSTVILGFLPMLIQHNYLKYSLENIVKSQLTANLTVINSTVWRLDP